MGALRPRLAHHDAPAEPVGNTGDFAEIVSRHYYVLCRIALRLTGSKDAVDDLVQETLLRGMRHFHNLPPGTNTTAWLVKILTRQFLDQCKRLKVHKAGPSLELLIGDTSERDPLISRITDDALWKAVHALEPELREVVELCYLKNMRYREIADQLGVPIGTVGSRLLRARERLREVLSASR